MIKISGRQLKYPLILNLMTMIMLAGSLFAQTTYTSANGGGSWTNVGSWDEGSSTPAPGDIAIITSGNPISLPSNQEILDITINSGGVFDCNGSTLTITRNLVNSGTWTDGGDVVFGGGTVSSSITYSGSGNFGNFEVNKTGGSSVDDVSLNNNIVVLGTFTITNGEFLPQSNIVRLAGNFTKTGGILTPGTSTFWFSEIVAYTVTTDADISFYNIIHNPSGLSGGRSLTFSSAFNYQIQNIFTRGGESASVDNNGGAATITYDTGTLRYLSTNTMTVGDEWPTGSTNNPDNVQLSTNSTITNSAGIRETDNLNIDGGGTFSISGGTVTINNQLTITDGTFSSGASGFDYGAGATLRYANSSVGQTVGNEWTASDAPANLVVANSSGNSPALDLGSGTPARSLSGNLTLSNGLVDFNTLDQTLTVGNNVYGGSGAFGTDTYNATLSVTGGNSAVTASDATTIYNLTMNTATGSLDNITVTNNLIIPSGNNVTLDGGITMSSGSNLNINGTGSLDLAGKAISASGATVNVTGTLDLNGGTLSGSPTVNLDGTLQTGGSGLSGPTWVLGGSSTIIYDGDSQELIASDFAFDNLTIANLAGVSVGSNDPTVNQTLNLSSGNLITTDGSITVNAISGGGTSSYVRGPLTIIGNGTKTFPIGDGSAFRPVTATGTTGNTTFRVRHENPGGMPQSPLVRISSVRYWQGIGTINGDVQLTYGPDDGVGNTATLRVAKSGSVGGTYSDAGNGGTTSSTITSGTIISLGYFTLGSTAFDNSLPVSLSFFSAKLTIGGVSLSWITESELENDGFNLYRKNKEVDENWQLLNKSLIPGQGNKAEKSIYEYEDRAVQVGITYQYKLESVSYSGVRVQEKIIEVMVPVPSEYSVLGNYPNPFNPTTNISFRLPEASKVSILIYGIRGNLVRELALNQPFEAGDHFITWDATDNAGQQVASGMYVYLFTAGKFNTTEKMLLLK